MKKLLCFCLTILLMVSVTPSTSAHIYVRSTDNGATYERVDGGIRITGYTNTVAAVLEIPATIDELPVVEIKEGAFSGCTALTAVTIPDTVTEIGLGAFFKCSNLESVVFPKELTNILRHTFYECKALTSITFPEELSMIGGGAFAECDSLVSVVIPDSVTTIYQRAFSGCDNLRSITIPDTVTEIDSEAFAGTAALSDEANHYDGVAYLGRHAIQQVEPNKTAIRIREGTKTIAYGAFLSGLTEITIPHSVTVINRNVFYWGRSLKDVYYTGNQVERESMTIGDGNGYLLNATWHYGTAKKTTASTTSATETTETSTKTATSFTTAATETTSTTTSTKPTSAPTFAGGQKKETGDEPDQGGHRRSTLIAVAAAVGTIVLAAGIVLLILRKKK